MGLANLDIYTVEKVSAWDGGQISSSRIRSGEIDRNGQPWIPESFRVGNNRMTPEVEIELKEPFGHLVEGPENDHLGCHFLSYDRNWRSQWPHYCSRGCNCSLHAKFGSMPDIALVDGLTKRRPWEPFNKIDESGYDNVME